MKGQLPGNVIKERAAALRDIGERKLAAYATQFVGQTLEIVIEGGEVGGKKKGLTRNYLPVQVVASAAEQGDCLQVKIFSARFGALEGDLV